MNISRTSGITIWMTSVDDLVDGLIDDLVDDLVDDHVKDLAKIFLLKICETVF